MIYTITFNPSLDYIANCEDFRLGETNRVSKEIIFPGGKGINVSIVLSNFGMDTTALGFLAGFTGEEIKRLIVEKGIRNQMIPKRLFIEHPHSGWHTCVLHSHSPYKSLFLKTF